jgi:hypothetical protein
VIEQCKSGATSIDEIIERGKSIVIQKEFPLRRDRFGEAVINVM